MPARIKARGHERDPTAEQQDHANDISHLKGFVRRRIPLLLRRAVTMLPALVPLVLLTSRRAVMGQFVNKRITTWAAVLVVALIVSLNSYLLMTTI